MSENDRPVTQGQVAWIAPIVSAVLAAAFFVWQMRADIDRIENDVRREMRSQKALLCDLHELKDRTACRSMEDGQ